MIYFLFIGRSGEAFVEAHSDKRLGPAPVCWQHRLISGFYLGLTLALSPPCPTSFTSYYGLYPRPGLYTWVDITPSSTRSGFRLTSRPTTYGLLGRTPYDWSYCSGNTRPTSVYRVYPGWGSHQVIVV
jgi:hypothetical protein